MLYITEGLSHCLVQLGIQIFVISIPLSMEKKLSFKIVRPSPRNCPKDKQSSLSACLTGKDDDNDDYGSDDEQPEQK